MADPETIERRAYEIWEAEGRPEGQDQAHWFRAVTELGGETGTPPSAPDPDRPGSPGNASGGFESAPDAPAGRFPGKTRR